jgi:oxygen-independent coproporphyrinogen-3 oxidase
MEGDMSNSGADEGNKQDRGAKPLVPPDTERVFTLLQRYDRPGPRYTSYPTAVEFGESYDEASYRSSLEQVNRYADEPLSLYVHVPFCEERCTYCGCNVVITKKRHVAAGYLDYLHREIDRLAESLPDRRRVSQYHWGGGTPTYLAPEQMKALHERVTGHFEIEPSAEVAIEIDPRVTSREQMDLLKEMGFNRLSMGVQDFDDRVQDAVNRNQTEDETRRLYETCREMGFESINLDLIYGLPLQTPESFQRTIESVIDMRPDRLAIYSYAFVPWLKQHQKRMEEEQLPDPQVKLRLFCIARELLLGAGYVQIGMDHFALPKDELAQAMGKRRLHRNFMGYTVRMGSDMVGVGVSSIGDVRGAFAQNHKKLSTYYAALDEGRFPVERGYLLSRDDRIRREVISRLMCNFYLDRSEIERAFDIDFGDYFAEELKELAEKDGPVDHGFLRIARDHLEVLGDGRLFVRNICMVFDAYMRKKKPGERMFSRTV